MSSPTGNTDLDRFIRIIHMRGVLSRNVPGGAPSIQQFRYGSQLTSEQIADRVGVTPAVLIEWETGAAVPSTEQYLRWWEAMLEFHFKNATQPPAAIELAELTS